MAVVEPDDCVLVALGFGRPRQMLSVFLSSLARKLTPKARPGRSYPEARVLLSCAEDSFRQSRIDPEKNSHVWAFKHYVKRGEKRHEHEPPYRGPR